jgi:hypothetical protein
VPQFPPGSHPRGGQAAAPVNRVAAARFYDSLMPLVPDLRRQGMSLRAIARELDRRGIRTRMELPHWSATQVARVLARGEASECSEEKISRRSGLTVPGTVALGSVQNRIRAALPHLATGKLAAALRGAP